MIGSVALMLDMSFGMGNEAKIIWRSMQNIFDSGFSTADLSSQSLDRGLLSTTEFGDKVLEFVKEEL